MSLALWSLTAFVTWSILLVCALGASRIALIFRGQLRMRELTPGIPHGPAWYWRLNRAHLNAIENLPIVATLILLGHLLQVQGAAFHHAALLLVPARMAQSVIHLSSDRGRVVRLRFFAYLVQILCYFVLLLSLVQRALDNS